MSNWLPGENAARHHALTYKKSSLITALAQASPRRLYVPQEAFEISCAGPSQTPPA